MKSCNKCGFSKTLSEYQKKASTKDGHARTCRGCDNAIRILRKVAQGKRLPDPPGGTKRCGDCSMVKPLEDFYARKSGSHEGRPYAYCIPCVKARNIARSRARGVLPRQDADPYALWRRRLALYGMTLEQYFAMLDSQNGKCLGCGVSASELGKRFAVDHDHSCCPGTESCGQCVRGLLCCSCNFVVGHAYDKPETLDRLATYLRSYVES